MKIACVQMNSGGDLAANIARVEALVAQAAGRGAQLAALPENAFLMETPGTPRQLYTQQDHPAVAACAALAKRHGLWLLAGSVAVQDLGFGIQDSGKTYNRSLLFNPQGEITAQYDKIHLFDVEVGDGQSYRESAKMLPGNKVVVAEIGSRVEGRGSISLPVSRPSPLAPKLGLSVCYDLRFPQLYRALAKAGAQILAVPSAFTQVTGEAHWHVLLRARAIENGCYVIAPAQTGTHPGNRQTYGHALIIDPWGKILADAGTGEGIIVADLDMEEVQRVRKKLPSLEHDREFS